MKLKVFLKKYASVVYTKGANGVPGHNSHQGRCRTTSTICPALGGHHFQREIIKKRRPVNKKEKETKKNWLKSTPCNVTPANAYKAIHSCMMGRQSLFSSAIAGREQLGCTHMAVLFLKRKREKEKILKWNRKTDGPALRKQINQNCMSTFIQHFPS